MRFGEFCFALFAFAPEHGILALSSPLDKTLPVEIIRGWNESKPAASAHFPSVNERLRALPAGLGKLSLSGTHLPRPVT